MAAAPKKGEKVKVLIPRAAQRLGWNLGRARKVWYKEARIAPEELDQLRAFRRAP